MSAPELTLHDIARRLRADEAVLEPSPELWARIVATHAQRQQRARWQRRTAAAAGMLALVATVGVALVAGNRSPPAIDWQARAQALELQLRAVRAEGPVHEFNATAAQNELARLDLALQAAYDDGAEAARLDALWKRRSELLDALLKARREDMDISRI